VCVCAERSRCDAGGFRVRSIYGGERELFRVMRRAWIWIDKIRYRHLRLVQLHLKARILTLIMTDLISLLTFPSISDGFTAVRPNIHDSENHATFTSLPLSKVARLDADSDSGSASRSRAGITSHVMVARGPVRVSISGDLRECYPIFLTLVFMPHSSATPQATKD
jgi:hypothetical protein